MQIHVARAGRELGVFSVDEAREKLASGELQSTDHGWAEGQGDWMLLSAFPDLAGITPAAAPPPAAKLESLPEVERTSDTTTTGPHVAEIEGRPISTSGMAIASLVCGILAISILPFVSAIAAIVFGHVAERRIRNAAGTMGGSGAARLGLTLGYWGFFLSLIVIMAGVAWSVAATAQIKAKQTKSLSNGRQIAIACQAYATDHDGAFPKTLEELVPKFLPHPNVLECPLSDPPEPVGFAYYGGKLTDPPSRIFLASKPLARRKWRMIGHVDGSVEWVKNLPNLPPGGR